MADTQKHTIVRRSQTEMQKPYSMAWDESKQGAFSYLHDFRGGTCYMRVLLSDSITEQRRLSLKHAESDTCAELHLLLDNRKSTKTLTIDMVALTSRTETLAETFLFGAGLINNGTCFVKEGKVLLLKIVDIQGQCFLVEDAEGGVAWLNNTCVNSPNDDGKEKDEEKENRIEETDKGKK